MGLWDRLQYLRPSFRRAQEAEMKAELESLAAIAERGELGNVTRVAEEARAAWGWTWLEQLYRDVQYALRSARHNPGFTATAVLSLALGIGANTAIFSLIDALMLHWLPVAAPQELVRLSFQPAHSQDPPDEGLSYAIVKTIADEKDVFASFCGVSGGSFHVGPAGSVSRVGGAYVTGDYYETLGLTPVLGRLLGRADDQPGAPLAAVISDGYWERQFSRNPGVVGQTLLMNSVPVTIVGVTARGFSGVEVGAAANITLAVAALPQLDPSMSSLLGPGTFWLRAMARPKHGASMMQAQARLTALWPQIVERAVNPSWTAQQKKELAEAKVQLTHGGTGQSYLRERFGRPLLVLLAVAGLVLLIACANVASLLLARATSREREISVRLAIGAGRGRIVRQLLTESTLLSAMGAALGVLFAWLGSDLLVKTLSDGGTAAIDLTPNWHVLGFASAVALANGILFGLAPALQTTALKGLAALREDSRVTRSRSRVLSALVSGQVALSLLLLVSAGLFVQTLQNLLNLDPGFRREGVLLVSLDGQREGYHDAGLTVFYSDLLERVRSVPGVASASLASHTPLDGWTWSEKVALPGQPIPARDNAVFLAAGPGFFTTLRTPLISGREFDGRDRGKPNVAIVNQAFAARFFAGRNPVGEYVTATVSDPPSQLQIVGLVKDSMTDSLRSTPRPTVYISYFQRSSGTDSLAIRAAGSLTQIAAAVRTELQPSFPKTPIEVKALTAQVEETLVQERLMAKLAGGFGLLGLVLACVGLYGLLAYAVVRRTREIGIRMALGARSGEVAWMVAGRALRLVAAGAVVGLPASWLLARKVQSMLFGLSATDAGILATAVVVLTSAGLVAAYFPARRASRVDPMTALRHE